MTDAKIQKLEQIGFKRWTKGTMDRLYINAEQLGLDCAYYKTGNISGADFKGERISNSEAYRMKAAKTYVDARTGVLHGTHAILREAAEQLIDAVDKE